MRQPLATFEIFKFHILDLEFHDDSTYHQAFDKSQSGKAVHWNFGVAPDVSNSWFSLIQDNYNLRCKTEIQQTVLRWGVKILSIVTFTSNSFHLLKVHFHLFHLHQIWIIGHPGLTPKIRISHIYSIILLFVMRKNTHLLLSLHVLPPNQLSNERIKFQTIFWWWSTFFTCKIIKICRANESQVNVSQHEFKHHCVIHLDQIDPQRCCKETKARTRTS